MATTPPCLQAKCPPLVGGQVSVGPLAVVGAGSATIRGLGRHGVAIHIGEVIAAPVVGVLVIWVPASTRIASNEVAATGAYRTKPTNPPQVIPPSGPSGLLRQHSCLDDFSKLLPLHRAQEPGIDDVGDSGRCFDVNNLPLIDRGQRWLLVFDCRLGCVDAQTQLEGRVLVDGHQEGVGVALERVRESCCDGGSGLGDARLSL